MSYKVKLPVFEGPFDLLVYLIENAQMSIYDIKISEITGQYLDYISTMQELNVMVSSEFMVLAAELLRIKSRMMLPKANAQMENLVEEDPRDELVSRIIEYKRCKAQAELLDKCQERMENVFSKPKEDISCYLDNPDEILAMDIESFAKTFKQFLHRKKKLDDTRKRYTIVERQRVKMENRMMYIKDTVLKKLVGDNRSMSFFELVPDQQNREDVVTSFLSVLQMTRENYLDVEQNGLYGDITVFKGKKKLEDFSKGEE